MDLTQRSLESNGKLFLNFKLSFQNFCQKPKNVQTNRSDNIDQSEMYYIPMDLTRQALQTNVKLFSNFVISFSII